MSRDPQFELAGTPRQLGDLATRLPAGNWGIAVSGGADSVALLRLAAGIASQRGAGPNKLSLHVLHLDHETRGPESSADADFVRSLAAELRLTATIDTRSALEASLDPAMRLELPANPSARYRRLRLALYQRAVKSHHLAGVMLAHHANDQAETVLFRLNRGGGYSALAGMSQRTTVAGVTLVRPLLTVRREQLRAYLRTVGQPWREDASNANDDYARNRVRKVLADRPELVPALLSVAHQCGRLRDWVSLHTPALPETFVTKDVAPLPELLASSAIAAWLRERGVAADDVAPAQVSAILEMCRDAASPARHAGPAGLIVRRRGGRVFAEGSL